MGVMKTNKAARKFPSPISASEIAAIQLAGDRKCLANTLAKARAAYPHKMAVIVEDEVAPLFPGASPVAMANTLRTFAARGWVQGIECAKGKFAIVI